MTSGKTPMARSIGSRTGGRARWRWAIAIIALLAGAPAAAQQGALAGNSGSAPTNPASGAGAGRADIPFDMIQQLHRQLSPPAGAPLDFQSQSGARINTRLGAVFAPELVAGTRLGGGTNSPSLEAVTIDPRDAFDAKVRSLSDTRQR